MIFSKRVVFRQSTAHKVARSSASFWSWTEEWDRLLCIMTFPFVSRNLHAGPQFVLPLTHEDPMLHLRTPVGGEIQRAPVLVFTLMVGVDSAVGKFTSNHMAASSSAFLRISDGAILVLSNTILFPAFHKCHIIQGKPRLRFKEKSFLLRHAAR